MIQTVTTKAFHAALRQPKQPSLAEFRGIPPRLANFGSGDTVALQQAVPFYRRWLNQFKPTLSLKKITDLTPDKIDQMGPVKAVLFDLDDTLLPMLSGKLEPDTVNCLKQLKNKGFQVGIVSNNLSKSYCAKALTQLTEQTGFKIPFVRNANKPGKEGYQVMLDHLELKSSEAVMVGDSLLGDVLGANRMGMKSIRAKWYTATGILNWKVMRYLRETLEGVLNGLKRLFRNAHKPIWVTDSLKK